LLCPPTSTYPAVSIIIPMYNVEKYIGECLDSILAQTLKNFEVIVVDDCSTDNSVAIVESYLEKFGGRLKIKRTRNNSGGCAVPRNFGLPFSSGEYILFMDGDDTITPTALNELYTIAKKFDADVVHCEKYYQIPDEQWNNREFRKQLKPTSYQTSNFVTEPTALPDDISVRVSMFHQRKFIHAIWVNLFRRDFILENEIKMCDVPAEDMIFTMCAVCTSKKFVSVPNVINFYRVRENSVSTEKTDEVGRFRKWFRAFRLGFEYLDEFLSGRQNLSQREDLKYLLFDTYLNEMCNYFYNLYLQAPLPLIDEILKAEFKDCDNVALKAFIFNIMFYQRLQIMQSHMANQFAAQAQQYKVN